MTRLYPFTFDEMYEDERNMPLDCSEYMRQTMRGTDWGVSEVDRPYSPDDEDEDEDE